MYRTTAQLVDDLFDAGFLSFLRLYGAGGTPAGSNAGLANFLSQSFWRVPFAELTRRGFLTDTGAALNRSNVGTPYLEDPDDPRLLTAGNIRFHLFGAGGSGEAGSAASVTGDPSLLVRRSVNPTNADKNMLRILYPLIAVYASEATFAIDAHAYLGSKVSDTQAREWPRDVTGAAVPEFVTKAMLLEVAARLRLKLSTSAGVEIGALKDVGETGFALQTVLVQAFGFTVGSDPGLIGRGGGRGASSLRDRVSSPAEIDFHASPLVSISAWKQLTPYFDLTRANAVYRSLS